MKINTQNTETPKAFVSAIERYFGIEFVYDMAATEQNKKAPRYSNDSLDHLWPIDGWCFLNPPFSNVGVWCKKCNEESKRGVWTVSIWPISSDHNMLPAWENASVYVIHGRVWSLVRGLMLCVWGNDFRDPVKGLVWDKKSSTLTRVW